MNDFEKEPSSELPRVTWEEFNTIANSENPKSDPLVLEWMKKHGFEFEKKGRAKILLDGEPTWFCTDAGTEDTHDDFGTVLLPETVAREALE